VAEGFLTVLQVVEIVFAPVEAVDEVESVQICEAVSVELEDVRLFWLEISTREEMEECHRDVFVIAPLEVINAVQACSAATLDLQ